MKQTRQKRRGFKDIAYEMVKGAFQGARKTRIMYASSLNFGQVNAYLVELISQDLIGYDTETKLYHATLKGRQYLTAYERYAETRDQLRQTESILDEICEKKLSQSKRSEPIVRIAGAILTGHA